MVWTCMLHYNIYIYISLLNETKTAKRLTESAAFGVSQPLQDHLLRPSFEARWGRFTEEAKTTCPKKRFFLFLFSVCVCFLLFFFLCVFFVAFFFV